MIQIFKLIFFILLFSTAQTSLAVDYNKVLSKASETIDGKLYSGFGFSREIINHSLFNQPLAPRDVDVAVLNSSWDKNKAAKELVKIGEIQNVQTMKTGLKDSKGNLNEVSQGFFVHVKIEDVVFDFKFFKNIEMAQERGWTNIEKILIPLNQPLKSLISIIESGRIKTLGLVDHQQGFADVINKKLKIVNWDAIELTPIKAAVHIARLVGKGYKCSLSDFSKLKKLISKNQSVHGFDSYAVERLYSRDQSSETYEFLNKLGVSKTLRKQRLFEAGEILTWINAQREKSNLTCIGNLLAT